MENSGKVRLSTKILITACRHVFRMMESTLNIFGDKRGQTELCYSTNTVQHDVFAMPTDAFQDGDAGFPTRYPFNGKLFNLRRLQAKSKVQTEVLDKLLQMTLQRMPDQSKKCKGLWVAYHKHVTILTLQSAQNRLR